MPPSFRGSVLSEPELMESMQGMPIQIPASGLNTNSSRWTNNTDEHPSPPLLASSVGKDVEGRLVPSSSTISLLSLNIHNQQNNSNDSTSSAVVDDEEEQVVKAIRLPPQHLRANSSNHLMLQRHQHYTAVPTHGPAITLVQHGSGSTVRTPDSPGLMPVSVVGSPSKMWLQTPPLGLQVQQQSVIQHIGSESPNLDPVGGSLPNMTPLALSTLKDRAEREDEKGTI
ncbi:hypothetical protein LJB42_003982 [Komagataella kurtzmanii]|nr:hypothetical protein LJB42_003982 [Komagataella kurtzmanii]